MRGQRATSAAFDTDIERPPLRRHLVATSRDFDATVSLNLARYEFQQTTKRAQLIATLAPDFTR